ncbi:hypothetical protein EON83_19510 [bacterium]|nr:MAG: hypothetical protein EON83_19510 [bacterium]
MNSTASLFSGTKADLEVVWRINPNGKVSHFRVGNGGIHDCMLTWRDTKWWVTTPRLHHEYSELMSRALFCLGIDDEEVLSKLNHPLSAHDQIELRLNFPREFWPTTWLI